MIEVDNLVKDFGPIRAVDGISFQAGKGEVVGFLGPNGAGKSTTMKMITCFLTPTSGTARVKGFDIHESPVQVRESLGYLPESAPLYDDMTVTAFLKFVAQVRGFSGAEAQNRIDRVFEICQLGGVKLQSIGTLSKGFRQRVCFAQALLHDPDILILDEPTDGLDPNQKKTVRDLIKSMSQDKVIILSTHILEEVDAVCSRAIIISDGRLKADDSPSNLKKQSKLFGAVTFTLADKKMAGSEFESMIQKSVTDIESVERFAMPDSDKTRIRCYPKSKALIAPAILDFLSDKKIKVDELFVEEGRLDEVFHNITQN